MIKFFRHIRQQLIREGKIGRYLKYALGEILLVMIGILLALQVNNWNQKEKDKDFESTMLHAIKSSLESDLSMHQFLSRRVAIKQQGIQNLLTMMDQNQTYADTTLLKAYNDMNIHMGFNYNKGGYEGIKSAGIDKISNDSLRNILIDTYEVQLPAVQQFIGKPYEDVSDNSYKMKLHNALWKRVKIQLPDGSYKLVSRTIDNENFLNQTELLDRIKIEQDDMNILYFWLNKFNRDVSYCLDAINKELGYD